jgi:hypothetical protein
MTSGKEEMEPMWLETRHGKEMVVAIEYQRGPRRINYRFVPFSVVTAYQGLGGSPSYYDFEHTLDMDLMWHNSGGGGGPIKYYEISNYCQPKPPPARLWLANGITPSKHNGKRPTPATISDLKAGGTLLLKQPLKIDGHFNPFDAANESEGGFVRCDKCKGYYDRESNAPCNHMTWCDDCCCFVNEKHVREDSHDGRPAKHILENANA